MKQKVSWTKLVSKQRDIPNAFTYSIINRVRRLTTRLSKALHLKPRTPNTHTSSSNKRVIARKTMSKIVSRLSKLPDPVSHHDLLAIISKRRVLDERSFH